jgi:hypothetical protein
MRTWARLLLVLLPALVLAAGWAARSSAGPDLRPITLIARVGRVPAGEEKQGCHRARFPRRQEMEVNRVQMFVRGGSHHVHLYRPYNGEVVYPPKDCPFAVDFSKWQLVTATQNPILDWQLPPGVAINFQARQPLMIQTHFVNAQALDVRGAAKAKIKLHPMDPATVTAHGGALFGQDRTVVVPPGDHVQISRCALTGDAATGRQLTIMALTGHYHFRGTEFTVYRTRADGTLGELVYEHHGYDDPTVTQYPNALWSGVLAPGEGLEWWCRYRNDTLEPFRFGANTQANEHCNLFGFYYPTETPQEAIDCIHRIDDLGNEVNEVIVAQ